MSIYLRPGTVHTFQDGGVPPQSQDVSFHYLLLGGPLYPNIPQSTFYHLLYLSSGMSESCLHQIEDKGATGIKKPP